MPKLRQQLKQKSIEKSKQPRLLGCFFIGVFMKYKFEISVSELTHLIDEWIFSERDRAIMKRRLIDNITYEKIAEEFELSPRRVSTIIYKNTQKIIDKIPVKYPQKNTGNVHENFIIASC